MTADPVEALEALAQDLLADAPDRLVEMALDRPRLEAARCAGFVALQRSLDAAAASGMGDEAKRELTSWLRDAAALLAGGAERVQRPVQWPAPRKGRRR